MQPGSYIKINAFTPLYNFFIKKISYRNFLMYNELTTKHFTKER